MTCIVFEPAEMIVVTSPKCGSTTVLDLCLRLADVPIEAETFRKHADRMIADGISKRHGVFVHSVASETLDYLQRRYPGFRYAAVARNPYERVVSGYRNKLNRYAKAFHRKAYYYGKIRQLLEGPRAWADVERGNRHMQSRISFERFLEGLEQNGVGFDIHFDWQTRLLALDRLKHDRILRLENLESAFLEFLHEQGVPAEMRARIEHAAPRNRSKVGMRQSALLTDATRPRIARLYAEDFARLGYSV